MEDYNPPPADVLTPVKFRFPLAGEPNPTNPKARKRVEDLTSYDSQTSMTGLLQERDATSIKAGALSGVIFIIAAAVLLVATLFRGFIP